MAPILLLTTQMKTCECSQCGVWAPGFVWGFTLLAREGWGVASATNPPGAAERAWLCAGCEKRALALARGQDRVSAARSERPKSKRLKVLVVDDHVLMLRSLVRMLTGCDTVVTTSPIQALAVLQSRGQFDAIVCDVMMPEMSGPELYTRCFMHSPELAQRFVFTSAEPVTARQWLDQAAAQVGAPRAPTLLSKPTSRALLMSAVSTAAARATGESGTYFMQFPSKLWTDSAGSSEAKGPHMATPAPSRAHRRSSDGFR